MSNNLNNRIAGIPLPHRMLQLKISDEGYPVPWFVQWIDGKPDFRVMDVAKLREAIRHRRCWLCGEQLGRFITFVIGPMCAINLTSAEPPCHGACADYAIRACPFLTQPRMRRNDKDLPEDAVEPAGEMIERNPGCIALWTTQSYGLLHTDRGVLFKLGPPQGRVQFYREGRVATRAEVMASIESGMPILEDMAKSQGPEAMAELSARHASAIQLLPA